MKIPDGCVRVGKETPDGVLSVRSMDEEEVGGPGLEGWGWQREILFGVRAYLGLRSSCLELEVGQVRALESVLSGQRRAGLLSPGLLRGS